MDNQLLIDSLKHERIRKQLENSSRHIIAHVEAIQELRNKYNVKGLNRITRENKSSHNISNQTKPVRGHS